MARKKAKTKKTAEPSPSLDDLLAARREAEREKRDEAWTNYREILNRRNTPNPNDPERLLEVLAVLGYDLRDYEGDVGTLDRLAELERLAGAEEEAQGALDAAASALVERRARAEQETRATEEELDQLQRQQRAARRALDQAREAGQELRRLRKVHRQLLGLPEPAEPEAEAEPEPPPSMRDRVRQERATAKSARDRKRESWPDRLRPGRPCPLKCGGTLRKDRKGYISCNACGYRPTGEKCPF